MKAWAMKNRSGSILPSTTRRSKIQCLRGYYAYLHVYEEYHVNAFLTPHFKKWCKVYSKYCVKVTVTADEK